METTRLSIAAAGLLLTLALAIPPLAWGHCDTLEGPVVVDAKAALAKAEITPVLKWVPAAGEAEIREAFQKTLAVRKGGKEAQELADTWFFETLVRVHRASEGAPYTGLKSGGTEEETIALADKALTTGDVGPLVKLVGDAVEHGIRHRFEQTAEKKKHAEHGVEYGRAYVAAYVDFIHYGERIYQAAEHPPSHHAGGEAAEATEAAAPAHHGH
ncbi:MAG TPA: DUF6448 family protein [bacterium]